MTARREPGTGLRLLLAIVVAMSAGCRREPSLDDKTHSAAASASASPLPIDRLLPGELGASSELVFGFPVPVGMSVERVFHDAAHLVGEVAVSGLVDYIRKHAQVGTAELTGTMMRFDQVRIPRQPPDQVYRFDLVQQARQVRLVIKNVTPPPTQSGLTEEERWRQAGLRPDGEPLDVSRLR
ncbi:MAG: hypothetical protein ACM3ZE_17385 [Myxococcales bacterium]